MIPLAEPDLTGKEREYVAEAVASGWVSGGGGFVRDFEKAVASACESKWCVATITGTAALHAALSASGVTTGDVHWMPSMSYAAGANALYYLGARPRFEDIFDDWTPDQCWVGPVVDAAASIGQRREPGFLNCLSFNGNKIVTTGQGGAIIGDDPADENRVRHLVNVAKTATYEHDDVGFNYRMPNLNAAIGCAQMERLEEFKKRKQSVMNRYRNAGVFLAESNWMAVAEFDDRETVIAKLRKEQIDARPFWKPLHRQTPYRGCEYLEHRMKRTESVWRRLVCLPCSTTLTEADQDKVIKACAEFSP